MWRGFRLTKKSDIINKYAEEWTSEDMSLFFYLIIFIFGLAIGSFLNCVICRLEKRESFLRDRSRCPHCQKELSWKDLVPLLSFLILRRRCRYCRQKISLQYPLVELATGILFVFIAIFNFQLSTYNLLNACFLFLVSCFLIIIFVYDLKHYIIPDKVIYPAIFAALVFNFLPRQIFSGGFNQFSILSAFGAAGFFFLIVLVSRGRWMGVGDIKLAFLMGLILGFPDILIALFLAFFFGAIIGIGLIISGKKTLRSEVPFGPFLVTGAFLALFFGENIIRWYSHFFYLI